MSSMARAMGGRTEPGWDDPRQLRRQEVAYDYVDGRDEDSPRPRILVDEINRAFAMRADAEAWITEMHADGWGLDHGPTPLCTWKYAGPTDSPANAWSVRLIRIVEEAT